jgi:hypothetical protein
MLKKWCSLLIQYKSFRRRGSEEDTHTLLRFALTQQFLRVSLYSSSYPYCKRTVVIYSLFIRYTYLVLGRTPLRLQNRLNSLGNSTRCRKRSTGMLVHSDAMASHSCHSLDCGTFMLATSPFHLIPKMLYWIDNGDCRPLKQTELAVMFQQMFYHSSIVQCW